jgi:hypothetical protein
LIVTVDVTGFTRLNDRAKKINNRFFFFTLNMFFLSIFDVLIDAAAHSEHGSEIGAKPVECSEFECLIS